MAARLPAGRVLDGRNRLAACKLAKVKPTYITYEGGDADGYALAVNAQRRDLNKSQRAMVAARASNLETHGSTRQLARTLRIQESRVSEAKAVLRYAAEKAGAVARGLTPLAEAYEVARQRRRDAAELAQLLAGLAAWMLAHTEGGEAWLRRLGLRWAREVSA